MGEDTSSGSIQPELPDNLKKLVDQRVNDFVERVQFWAKMLIAIVGGVNLIALIAGFVYIVFILPGAAVNQVANVTQQRNEQILGQTRASADDAIRKFHELTSDQLKEMQKDFGIEKQLYGNVKALEEQVYELTKTVSGAQKDYAKLSNDSGFDVKLKNVINLVDKTELLEGMMKKLEDMQKKLDKINARTSLQVKFSERVRIKMEKGKWVAEERVNKPPGQEDLVFVSVRDVAFSGGLNGTRPDGTRPGEFYAVEYRESMQTVRVHHLTAKEGRGPDAPEETISVDYMIVGPPAD